MRRTSSWPVALLALGLVVLSPSALALELRGVFRQGDCCYFSLHEEKSGVSAWLSLGEVFGEWRLVSYDFEQKVLVLAKGDKLERVKLAVATIAEAKPGEPLPRAIAKAELAKLAASAAHLTPRIMPQQDAIRLGLAGPDRSLSEMSDDEYGQLMGSLTQNQQLSGAARALGVPVGYKPFTRDILPPELSANLTDADMAEVNAQFAAALDQGLVPLMKRIEAERRAQAATSSPATR